MLVTQTENRWEFRPSSALVRKRITGASVGAIFCLCLAGIPSYVFYSTIFSADDIQGIVISFVFCALLLGGAVFCAREAVRCWHLRIVPLIIEESGQIHYGNQEICGVDMITALIIVKGIHGEDFQYGVQMTCEGGRVIELPSPYFNQKFKDMDLATTYAEEFASPLGVAIRS